MEVKPARATKFYITLGVATLVGLALNFVHFDPIRSLFIAVVLVAPVMALMMLMTRNPKIMGKFTLPLYLPIVGWIGTIAMFGASLAFLIATLK